MCCPEPTARHPLLCIVPPHLLEHLARQTDPRLRSVAAAARNTLALSSRLREDRRALGQTLTQPLAAMTGKVRSICDAKGRTRLPGATVRGEGDPPGGDPAVNEAYDGLGATYDLYWDVYARNSIDGRGMALVASVHFGADFNNAFWNGTQMVFGDGDGVIFQRFTKSLDVIGHELTHGVTQHEARLAYSHQSGALNEHFSDVFGSLVKQLKLRQTATAADWLIGEGLFAPGIHGRALRSMKEPGTAYDDPRIGKDPQPAHMRDYVETSDDSGGVHINSGIPNRAFVKVALGLEGYAWKQAGLVWYRALTQALRPHAKFVDAAEATTEIAGRDLGAAAAAVVREAWAAVGIPPAKAAGTRVARKSVGRKEGAHAHRARTKRRARRASHRTGG